MGKKTDKEWEIKPQSNGDIDFRWDGDWIFRIASNRNDDGIRGYYLYTTVEHLYITPQQLGVGMQMLLEEYEHFVKCIAKQNTEHAKRLFEEYGEDENS